MSNRYYFAYGSNMNITQMSDRCTTAVFLDIAKLPRYRFVINTRGVATVVKDSSREVYGILWNITPDDEKALDKYEGVQWGTYEKMKVEVHAETILSYPIQTLTYIASNSTPGYPKADYLNKIVAAAAQHGLPIEYVEELKTWLRKGDRAL